MFRILSAVLAGIMLSGCDAFIGGNNTHGQLGVADPTTVLSQPAVGSPWSTVEAGRLLSCGIAINGTLWCWGSNSRGEAGVGSTANEIPTPTQVGTATDWEAVSPGYRHSCGIRSGQLWCWGSDNFGQLGNGSTTTTEQLSPVRVGSFSDWTEVDTGLFHACAMRVENGFNKLYCWGLNSNGQVGDGTTVNNASPYRLLGPGGAQWVAFSAGNAHTCAVEEGGDMYCWGSNSDGQLGTESYDLGISWNFPLHPVSGANFQAVSAGERFTCGLSKATVSDPFENSRLYCWGDNTDQQIIEDEEGFPGSEPDYFRTPQLIGQRGFACDGVLPCVQTDMFSLVDAGYNHWCAIREGSGFLDLNVNIEETYTVDRELICGGAVPDSDRVLLLARMGVNEPEHVSVGDRHTIVLAVQGDRDGDGVSNGIDNCPDDANPFQEDSDDDGIGDVCDNPGC